MTGLLDGKVVLVTGAGRGIGAAIARLAAREGAAVVVNDLGVSLDGAATDGDPAEKLAAEIRLTGGRAEADAGSVADPAQAEAMVARAVRSFGRLDAVVNNAGIMVMKAFSDHDPGDFDRVVATHLRGSYLVSTAAARVMKNGGAFVHMTSTAALIGNPGGAAYNAAKAGIIGLSRSMALDLATRGIRSNCLAPSAVTRMSQGVSRLREAGAVSVRPKGDIPAEKRQGQADQVAPLAVFLLSDAAAELTGQIFGARGNEVFLYSQPRPVRSLHRDGGWTPSTLAAQLVPAWRSSLVPQETLQDVFAGPPQ